MGSEHAILIRPDCPPTDDPEIQALLNLLADLAGADWACLELEPHEAAACEPITVGRRYGDGVTVRLEPGRYFGATLRLGCPADPMPPLVDLASLALRKTLQARRFHEQVRLLRSALDTTSSAVLLFGPDGDIVYANPPADELLSRQTEGSLVVLTRGAEPQPLFTWLCQLVEEIAEQQADAPTWQGTLALSDGSVLACEILRMAREPAALAAEVAPGGPARSSPPGRAPAHASAAGDREPDRIGPPAREPNILVILQATKALPDLCLPSFAASYQLSRREVEVLRHLLAGRKAPEIADELGISHHTVRDHLKHLYRKTETRSHTELLNLVSYATSTPPIGE
jgi:DNA-binding CsgD family transcriptional regulator/PAS domain-containing protein